MSPDFSNVLWPTGIYLKDWLARQKEGTQSFVISNTVTSKITPLGSRMPKVFVLNTMIHRRGKNQVDIARQLKMQSYSTDITWNTLGGDQRWSFLQSGVPTAVILYSQ